MTSRIVLIGAVLGALSLSACESVGMGKYNPFGQGAADNNTAQNVSLRADAGDMTPLPNTPPFADYKAPTGYSGDYQVQGNSSVEIYNDGFADVPAPYQDIYGGGLNVANNSSVTIYPLDGGMPMVNTGMAMNSMGGGMMPSAMGYQGGMMGGSDNQIFFKHGSSRLGSGDMRRLSQIADAAKFAPVSRITVAGHASPPTQVGSNSASAHALNLKESANRSVAVSQALIKKGVPAEKIKTVSWGATMPTGNNSQDRRVDIIMGER